MAARVNGQPFLIQALADPSRQIPGVIPGRAQACVVRAYAAVVINYKLQVVGPIVELPWQQGTKWPRFPLPGGTMTSKPDLGSAAGSSFSSRLHAWVRDSQ
eukprot:367933-Rhodomonas_salina.3